MNEQTEVQIIEKRLKEITGRSRLVDSKIFSVEAQMRGLRQESKNLDRREEDAILHHDENAHQQCMIERDILNTELILLECWSNGLQSDRSYSENAYNLLTEQLERVRT